MSEPSAQELAPTARRPAGPPFVGFVGVPFDGMGRRGGQALAPSALRAAGLSRYLRGDDVLVCDPDLPAATSARGPAGFLNEAALLAMTDHVRRAVGEVVSAGGRPLLYGADCSVLLGAIPAVHALLGEVALAVVDAHEDATPPAHSIDGEAANMEIGILAGWDTPALPPALQPAHGAVPGEQVALLGTRDAPYRDAYAIASVRSRVGTCVPVGPLLARDERAVDGARQVLAGRPWWLHVDLDVLARDVFPYYGAPGDADLPGGLDWGALQWLTDRLAADADRCVGASVVIYNPEKDPTGQGARAVVSYLDRVAGLWRPGA